MKNDYKITGIFEAIISGFGLAFIALIINEILEIKHLWFSASVCFYVLIYHYAYH